MIVQKAFRHRGAMVCSELVELVTDYSEGTLDPQTRARFDRHVRGCDGCTNYLRQYRTTVTTLSRVDGEVIDPAFRNRLLDGFRASHWSGPT